MPQQGRVLSTDPNAGTVISTDPNAGTPISTDLNSIVAKPPSARGQSVVFPSSWESLGNTIGDLAVGGAKGTGRMLVDLAKSQVYPGDMTGVTPFDFALSSMKPEGPTQTLGSFLPDILLGVGSGMAAARTSRLAPGATDVERFAERLWDKASDRQLADISGRPGFAREVLKAKIGPMTQTNAVKQAELRASKVPGVIDTRTPAVQEVEPVTLFDEGGNPMQVGGVEGQRGTGFYSQPTKPRAEAFKMTQQSYSQANRRPRVFGIPMPTALSGERMEARTAQELFNHAGTVEKMIPGGSTGLAAAIIEAMRQRSERNNR